MKDNIDIIPGQRERLTHCRNGTTLCFIRRHTNITAKGELMAQYLFRSKNGREWVWSGDHRHKDSMQSVANLESALAEDRLRGGDGMHVKLRTWEDKHRDWEHFHWEASTPLPPPVKSPIEDLFC